MNVIALVLMIIAAVIFFFLGDTVTVGGYRRTSLAMGLFFLTLGLIVQFAATSHSVTF